MNRTIKSEYVVLERGCPEEHVRATASTEKRSKLLLLSKELAEHL